MIHSRNEVFDRSVPFAFGHLHVPVRLLHAAPSVLAGAARDHAQLLYKVQAQARDISLGELFVDARVSSEARRRVINKSCDGWQAAQTLVKRPLLCSACGSAVGVAVHVTLRMRADG